MTALRSRLNSLERRAGTGQRSVPELDSQQAEIVASHKSANGGRLDPERLTDAELATLMHAIQPAEGGASDYRR